MELLFVVVVVCILVATAGWSPGLAGRPLLVVMVMAFILAAGVLIVLTGFRDYHALQHFFSGGSIFGQTLAAR